MGMRWSRARVVCVAVVLGATGLAKLLWPLSGPMAVGAWIVPAGAPVRWLQFGVLLLEVGLACALLCERTRNKAIAAGILFLAVSIALAGLQYLAGVSTGCGCLGSLPLSTGGRLVLAGGLIYGLALSWESAEFA